MKRRVELVAVSKAEEPGQDAPHLVGLLAFADLRQQAARYSLDCLGSPAIVGKRRGPAPDFK